MVIKYKQKLFGRNHLPTYYIPHDALILTAKVLLDYSKMSVPHEGMVYWAGIKSESNYYIRTIFAPATSSSEFRVETNNQSNFKYVNHLSKRDLIHIGQVHSHPRMNVNHSVGDNQWAAFKVKDLISIVVPVYGQLGMQPLSSCGIHIYDGYQFKRIFEREIKKYFKITEEKVLYEDLR